MDDQSQERSLLFRVCLLAGKLMLQNGAETYRVEDTMSRIAMSFGFYHAHSFVTPTVIMFSTEGIEPTQLIRVTERSTNLEKVTQVNQVSREMSAGLLTLDEAFKQLEQIGRNSDPYPVYIQIIAAAVVSSCFLIMFQGQWIDFLSAFICGAIGFSVVIFFQRIININFFAEFFAALFIGVSAMLITHYGWGQQLDKIIVGSVMPLVPGVLITNAVRDLLAGHLIAGLSKGAEAFLTAFAIGSGVAVVFLFIS